MHIKVKHTPWLDLSHGAMSNIQLLIASLEYGKGLSATYNQIKELVSDGRV